MRALPREALGFEYQERWGDLYEHFAGNEGGALDLRVAAFLEKRDRDLEDFLQGETFGWEQVPSGVVALGSSNNYPVRRGGRPRIVVTVREQFTTAGELTLYRNDVVFATMALGTGISFWDEVWPVDFAPNDRARNEVTDAGAGGVGILVTWRF